MSAHGPDWADLRQRARAAQVLHQMRDAEAKPRYHPYGAAETLMRSRRPEILLSGPAGTGKSRACLEKLHWLLGKRWPGARGLIVRKTRESLTEAALQTFEDHVLGAGHKMIGQRQRNIRQTYKYDNGSVLNVGGIDKASKIMSTEYDFIYVQEATELTPTDWESLTTRLRNGKAAYQQLMADCNPDAPTHWLKARCDRGDTRMVESRHEDNPRLYDRTRGAWTAYGQAYIARLEGLTGVRKERLRYGRWVAAEGVVYEEFDRTRHIITWTQLPGRKIPESWRRFRVIDFGYTHPFVCQWWAEDHDGRLYRYREIYMTGRLVTDHAAQIKALSQGEQIETTITDWDAEDRATLEAEGITTVKADKRIGVGIQKVQDRLRDAGDRKPRIFFLTPALVEEDKTLVDVLRPFETTQEFDSYVWPRSPDGRISREVPQKSDDHGMDCMRYAVMFADEGVPSIEALPDELVHDLLDFDGL